MFDLKEFLSTVMVGGFPLLLVVMGLVEWLKELGVKGKALTASSMALGTVFGLLYEMAMKMPTDFAGWFAAVVFGLLIGLVASGIYKVAEGLAIKSGKAAFDLAELERQKNE